jgi:hypothetical protein
LNSTCGFRIILAPKYLLMNLIRISVTWGVTVKEKVDAPAPMTSDDDTGLLDNVEAPLIKDGSPPPTSMDINMVFTLSAKFRGVEEEIAQICISPKEAVFEKPEESS